MQRAAEYIHNNLFVLHLVNTIPDSKVHFFLLYYVVEFVCQAGKIFYTELSLDPIGTDLLRSGFMAGAYQRWAFDIASAAESHNPVCGPKKE